MKNNITCPKALQLIAMLGAFTLGSCAELFELDTDPNECGVEQITLSRHVVDIMEGDSIVLDMVVNPPTDSVQAYWFTDYVGDNPPAVVHGPRIYAYTEGTVIVFVMAMPIGEESIPDLDQEWATDACQINVFRWADFIPPSDHPRDMVIYADAVINGVPIDTAYQEIAALIDGEVCGRAQYMTHRGKSFFEIRLWRDQIDYAPVSLQCYDHHAYRRITLQHEPLTFDGEAHGTLSDLFHLTGTVR